VRDILELTGYILWVGEQSHPCFGLLSRVGHAVVSSKRENQTTFQDIPATYDLVPDC